MTITYNKWLKIPSVRYGGKAYFENYWTNDFNKYTIAFNRFTLKYELSNNGSFIADFGSMKNAKSYFKKNILPIINVNIE